MVWGLWLKSEYIFHTEKLHQKCEFFFCLVLSFFFFKFISISSPLVF